MAISQIKCLLCPFLKSNAIFCTFLLQAFCIVYFPFRAQCASEPLQCTSKALQCTEKCKSASLKKSNSAQFTAQQHWRVHSSQLVQTSISWLWPERERGEGGGAKKSLIYGSLAIAPHYFQRRPFLHISTFYWHLTHSQTLAQSFCRHKRTLCQKQIESFYDLQLFWAKA